jgi:uncharacterized protein (TIGR00730 family)
VGKHHKNRQFLMKKNRPLLEEKDFTGGGILALPSTRVGTTGEEAIDKKVADLVAEWDCNGRNPLIEEMLVTALKLGHDENSVADLKLINRTLKEMRASSKVFHPYQAERKVAVYGSARTPPGQPEHDAAIEFSEKMREHKFMTITGAGEGIMGAAQQGAGRDNSFGLNIKLPFEQGANETIIGDHKLITYNYFFTRKLAFVKESDATALFPGGFGTMDEGFEVLTLIQTGKASVFPVVMVDAPGGSYWKTFQQFVREHLGRLKLISEDDFNLFKITDNVDEAVEEIVHFYRVFHSYRFVGKKMVIRLRQKLSDRQLGQLDGEFSDLLESGHFEIGEALPEERNEEALHELPRLIFKIHRGKAGRLRLLINRINSFD